MGCFNVLAILDLSVGRFGCSCGPFSILPQVVLDKNILKIYGPFLLGLFWFSCGFGIDPSNVVCTVNVHCCSWLLMCCRQAEIQHKVVEDVYRLFQLSADSGHYRREDFLLSRR